MEAVSSGLKCNQEAQHRYLTWRVEKLVSILAFVIVSISYISFIDFSDAHPSVEETQNPKNPENSGKKWNLVKGIAALTSEFCPQNFFLLSFLFLLYVASLSWLPYILCITLFLVNADIKHDSSPLSHLVPAISQIFVIFIFYLF